MKVSTLKLQSICFLRFLCLHLRGWCSKRQDKVNRHHLLHVWSLDSMRSARDAAIKLCLLAASVELEKEANDKSTPLKYQAGVRVWFVVPNGAVGHPQSILDLYRGSMYTLALASSWSPTQRLDSPTLRANAKHMVFGSIACRIIPEAALTAVVCTLASSRAGLLTYCLPHEHV